MADISHSHGSLLLHGLTGDFLTRTRILHLKESGELDKIVN
jgi:hypothetical protein